MSHSWLSMGLHVAAHAFHTYRHQQHARHKAARSHAHGMSKLAGAAFDAAEELGWEIRTLKPTVATLVRGDAMCVFSIEDGDVNATSIVFHIKIHRDTRETRKFLADRSRETEYGRWTLLPVEDGLRVGLVVRVEPGAVDGKTFAWLAKYMQKETGAMRERLQRLC